MYINFHPKQLFVKILSSEMIEFFLWERRFFCKTRPSAIMWEPFEDFAPSSTAVDNWDPNRQHGHEIHKFIAP
jgi:hypothetical protein